MLKRLKGFREDFFMYADDSDLCLRVLKAGFNITVVPQAKVFHCEQAITPTDQKIEFHKIKNFFSLYLLHARLRVLPEFYFRYGVIGLLRAVVLDRQRLWPRLKASGWFLLKAPSLIADRYRGTKLSANERALRNPV